VFELCFLQDCTYQKAGLRPFWDPVVEQTPMNPLLCVSVGFAKSYRNSNFGAETSLLEPRSPRRRPREEGVPFWVYVCKTEA
jgi:hypothetical protein